MRKIFLGAILFSVFTSNGQTRFGIKAGAGISDRSKYPNSSAKFIVGTQAWMFMNFQAGNYLFAEPAIGYNAKGYRLTNIHFTDPLGNDIGSGNINFRFDYLELSIPIQYLVASNDDLKLFSGVGPYFAYRIGGREKLKHATGQISGEDKSRPLSENGLKDFDFGIAGLISAQIKKRWYLAVNFETGLINTNEVGPSSRNNTASITAGYFLR